MQRKIFFQKCNFNYIFFVLYILVFFLNIYIGFDNYAEKFEIEQKKEEYYLPLQIMHLYISNLSNFLAIIPYLIRKRIIRKNENIENLKIENKVEKDGDLSFIYNNNQNIDSKKRKKNIKYFVL